VDGGTISLIEMFENVEVALPPEAPEKSLFPMRWAAIGLWRRKVEVETPVNYVQLVLVKAPENEEVFRVESPFVVNNEHYNFRNIVNFVGIPISKTGVVDVEIYLKQEGEDEWKKHFSYPINVTRTLKEKEDDDENVIRKTSRIETETKHAIQRVSSVSGTSEKTRVRSKKRHPKKRK